MAWHGMARDALATNLERLFTTQHLQTQDELIARALHCTGLFLATLLWPPPPLLMS